MKHAHPTETNSTRHVAEIIHGMPTSDGAGVQLTRVIGQPALPDLDPFLLLDAFRSDQPEDYIAGFPPHPHRGFEAVSYILNGRVRHRDSAGHEGVIEAGGIQWMTAARGIVHSEMPEQENGLLEGFQLWINLPASHKMDDPAYQEFPVEEIPLDERPGTRIKVISGTTSQGIRGPVIQPLTEPLYLDVSLAADTTFTENLPQLHNAFIYVIAGQLLMTDKDGLPLTLSPLDLAVLEHGDRVHLTSSSRQPARFLLIAGKPLHEPVARGGPFVMNNQAEIMQAYRDFQHASL